jgi:oligopeptide/dipeptide ABC transporter ATP-binding protein
MALLEVRDLRVSFDTDDGTVYAVQGMSFSVGAGQTLGIVGESGSGKSVTTQAIMGLAPGAKISGEAVLDGADLISMSEDELQRIRGRKVSLIFQDPLTSLHPLYRVGHQIAEVMETHGKVARKEAIRRAVDLLGRVGIPEPDKRVRDYPHQFSGGMRQRVMIAMALAYEPMLIIADEPTTALDVTVQAQILELLGRMQQDFGTAVILITHDLGVVADVADDVVIMYGGRPMERADVRSVFVEPHHPYTQGLLESIPSYSGRTGRLKPIQGYPPSLMRMIEQCPFAPRCAQVRDACRVAPPPLKPVGSSPGHLSACVLDANRVGLASEPDEAGRAVGAAEER